MCATIRVFIALLVFTGLIVLLFMAWTAEALLDPRLRRPRRRGRQARYIFSSAPANHRSLRSARRRSLRNASLDAQGIN
jgi:hypothetical protein